MKRLFCICALCVWGLIAHAGSDDARVGAKRLDYAAYVSSSYFFDSFLAYDYLIKQPWSCGAGLQVGINTLSTDNDWWAEALGRPRLGIGLNWDHASPCGGKRGSQIGDFLDLTASFNFNLLRLNPFVLSAYIEAGPAFTNKKYYFVSNPTNYYIGSHVLAAVGVGLEARFRVADGWELAAVGALRHHSNGMTAVPNWGVNQVFIGLKTRWNPNIDDLFEKNKELERPDYPKGWHWNIYTAGGVHACDVERMAIEKQVQEGTLAPSDELRAPVRARVIVGTEAEWRYHPLLSTGIGIEGMWGANRYRESDMVLWERECDEGYSPFLISANLIQHLHYKNLSLHLCWGVYVFKKVGLSSDIGWNFQRVGLRYQLPKFKSCGNMYVGFDMRAHNLDRSYSLEASVGFSL
ncbi:MAG: acyloxyacyl hydrolase [Bacteroidales bacterium]|nr:acyloxyacyl hydrolase [Bacteroidales bacterium]